MVIFPLYNMPRDTTTTATITTTINTYAAFTTSILSTPP